jgi:dTDP-glucose 4,6-dehydratase
MTAPVPRVLLTGAGGFIGHHVLEHLLIYTDWEIVCTDSFRHEGKTDRIVEVLRGLPGPAHRVSVLTHDLTAPWSAQAVELLGRIDYMINLASESNVDLSITYPVPFVRNNVELVLHMLELARVLRPSVFVQMSTDEVYGPAPDHVAHAEWATILPSNPYSASKAAQEAIAISYWRTYGVPVILLNTMNILGERQSVEKYLPMLISRISRGEQVTVHGTPERIGSRYYLHARNLADAILHIIGYLPPTVYTGSADGDGWVVRPDRYHVVGEREIDNLELARLVADQLGMPLRHEFEDFHSTRPGHDRRYALDGTLLAAKGWVPPVPLAESIARTVDWTVKHPEWLLPTDRGSA